MAQFVWLGPAGELRRPLLIQALAYRSQEKAFGGLKATTRPSRNGNHFNRWMRLRRDPL